MANILASRFGVFVTQGFANFIGQNVIENQPESDVFVRQGSLFMGNGFASLDTTRPARFRNNGGLPIDCTNGTETSVAIPASAAFTGNGGGDTHNCTGF